MTQIEWTADLEIGIPIIDSQHRRIVEYLNQLNDIRTTKDRGIIARVIEELVDYTQTHFSFEESILEESGYPFLKAHQSVHRLFIKRIGNYQERFSLGDDIVDDLYTTLVTWLLNHIKRDDADYGDVVKTRMMVPASLSQQAQQEKLKAQQEKLKAQQERLRFEQERLRTEQEKLRMRDRNWLGRLFGS
jgi:hemerythrin